MKKLFSLFFLMIMCVEIGAVPARPVSKTLRTVDGKSITVVLRGDEHFSFYQAEDGTRYHQLKSGALKQFSEFEFLTEQGNAMASAKASNTRRVTRIKARQSGVTGKHTGLVILANFNDVKFTTGSKEVYQDFFNMENYSGYDNSGSVHDYFYDQSYGKFDLNFDVVGPVDVPQKEAYYGAPTYDSSGNITSHDKDPWQYAVDAVTAAVAANPSIDLSKYDWDKDGTVDQVFIIYPGYPESDGADVNTIWPHESSIEKYKLEFNGVKIGTYGCASELAGTSGSALTGIGSSCHEFCHCLGLMDTYDTSGSGNVGMGDWDIMGHGNYLSNSHAPQGYTAYERWVSGWLEPTVIDEETTVMGMPRLEDEGQAYVLYNEGNANEYYILENRYSPKWGKELGAHGLLIMHVDYDKDYWYYNGINTDIGHERMTVVPADNTRVTNYAGDPYPGGNNNTALTDTSTPASTVFNKNVDDTYYLGKPIGDIVESDEGLISFKAMTGVVFGPKNIAAQGKSSTSFILTWDKVKYAESYEVSISTIDAPKTNPYEAVMYEEDFSTSCYADKVVTLNNVAGRLDNYTTTKGWTGTYLYRGPKGLQLGMNDITTGTLETPTIESPHYGLTTARVTFSPAVSDVTVSTAVNVYVNGTYLGKFTLSVSKEATYILGGIPEHHSNVAFEIVPDKRLNVSYFALYDGDFSEEDFEKYRTSGVKAFHASMSKVNFATSDDEEGVPTTGTSYTYDKVTEGKAYVCKVRAKLNTGSYSKWSASITYTPTSTGIGIMPVQTPVTTNDAIYDLMGRKLPSIPTSGIYIQNGRKLIKQ